MTTATQIFREKLWHLKDEIDEVQRKLTENIEYLEKRLIKLEEEFKTFKTK